MNNDGRIYSSFSRLSLLAKRGRDLSWRPPYSKISPMSGVQKSHQRGRGLDFVELRHYFPGDDVRCIDWRVTQRTGQAFIRLYAEEKDKNTVLIIDLRSSMFFASDGSMKSVIASELAAIIAGRIQLEGDRIGALLMTDKGIAVHQPQRGEKSLLTLLENVVFHGQSMGQTLEKTQENSVRKPLVSDGPETCFSSQASLDDVLKQLCLQKTKESQIFMISDFIDFTVEKSNAFIAQLAKRNNVIALRVSDPFEDQLPEIALVMGNGNVQLDVSQNAAELRQRYNQFAVQQNQQLETSLTAMGIPCLHLSTHLDCWQQLAAMSIKGQG